MAEEKSVPGYPDYIVSTDGEVFSLKHGRRKKMNTGKSGKNYPTVCLCRDGTITTKTVHSLVASLFLGRRKEGHVVRHLDGDPSNCKLSNLAYGTFKDNEADKKRHGRTPCGEKIHGAKLTEADVLKIRSLFLSGHTQASLVKMFSHDPAAMNGVIHGHTWAHIPVPDYSTRVPIVPYGALNRGERNARAKLNAEKVKKVVSLLGAGFNTEVIATQVGVSRSAISHIAAGRTWGHITGISP